MTKDEFLFDMLGRRRDKTEQIHDLLVVAKEGLMKTRLMRYANLNWEPMRKMLVEASAAGLIEEVEMPQYERYGMKNLAIVWKTTEKGLKYVKALHDAFKILQGEST